MHPIFLAVVKILDALLYSSQTPLLCAFSISLLTPCASSHPIARLSSFAQMDHLELRFLVLLSVNFVCLGRPKMILSAWRGIIKLRVACPNK
jgi:hypothetical protein